MDVETATLTPARGVANGYLRGRPLPRLGGVPSAGVVNSLTLLTLLGCSTNSGEAGRLAGRRATRRGSGLVNDPGGGIYRSLAFALP